MGGFRYEVITEYWPLFMEGAKMTIQITIICVVLGVILGMALGMARLADARHAPWRQILKYCVRWPVTVYVSFFRGTPLFVQILLMLAGIIAITLNAGAYLSEVFRAGIQSLDKGQMEAARSVGMTYWQAMFHIILPQAFRRMLPPLGNNAIAILKDSSLVSAIGLAELAYAARTVAGASARYWEPYITISLMYWVMTLALAYLVKKMEEHLGKGDDNR